MSGMTRLVLTACVTLCLVTGPAAARQTSTWNGIGSSPYDWNLPGNWNPLGVPGATTIPVIFTDTSAGTVNVSSTVDMAQSLTFTNTTTSYNITSSSGVYLTIGNVTNGSAITVNGNLTGSDVINLASISTGSLLFAGGSTLTVANNTPSGGALVVGPNTVIGTSGSGGVVFGGLGGVFFSGSFAANGGTPNNQVVGNITHAGPGLFDYSGSGANLGSGSNLVLNGGVLELDYTENTPTTKTNGQLILDGGVLSMLSNASTPFTQSIPDNTFVSAGHTDVKGAGIGTITLNAGTITHSVGGTVDFTPSSALPVFSIQTSSTNTNGLLGTGPAFATIGGGFGWATVSGVVVAQLAGYSVNIFGSGDNTDITANDNPATFTTNSLRFNTGTLTLTLSGTNTLQSGGLLVTPNAIGGTITGGTLEATSSGELLFHIYNSGFAVNSNLVSTVGLTKTGPGNLNLGGNNSGLTGPINVNRGSIYATALAAISSASAINFNDDRSANNFGGLQSFTVDTGSPTGTLSMPIRLSAGSVTDYGTYFSTGNSINSIITLSGVISTANPGIPINTSIRFTGQASNTSGFYLTNTANTFTGNVSLYQGYLGIAADGSLGNSANVLNLDVSDAVNGGLVFLNNGTTVARKINSNFPTRIVVSGTNSDTISGVISGVGGIYKDGTGTLTISNPTNTVAGGVNVLNGTLLVGASGAVPSGANITVSAGATFSFGSSGLGGVGYGTVTLNGGTLRDPAGNGTFNIVNQIVTGPAGGTVDYTGATNANALGVTTGITINGNSTWLSPANGTTIAGPVFTIPITVVPGVTLNNGIALGVASSFNVTGGGTLFQNSDATNVLGMSANVTVSTGTTFRVTDASSNGGVGDLGNGEFGLDGGTFSYGGASATTSHPIALTSNGGTIDIESATTTLVASGSITAAPGGALTKTGLGTLVPGSSGNTFASLTINAGTVQTANDNTLGTGPITVGPGATLNYTGSTSTSRTINLFSGSLNVATSATLTLNGAAVNGGFMPGAGSLAVTGGTTLSGVTTYPSMTINQTGAGSFVNFTNGGPLNIAAGLASPSVFSGFTNQGSGAITVGAGSQANAANLQTYGMLTLTPNTTATPTILTNTGNSPLFFNGGSQTFIGTPATADPTGQNILDYVDLHGNNAIVAGGLLVNNGGVFDTVGAGTGTIIAEFGALVKGAGFYQNTVKTQNGGKFQTGNSPGSATFGNFVFGPGGVNNYVFAIDDATGTAGPSPNASGLVSGWGLVKAVQVSLGAATTPGSFTWTATPSNALTVAIDTLVNPTTVGTDVAGPMADFDPTQSYSWTAARWTGSYAGPTDAATLDADTAFDTSGIINPIAGTFGWSLDSADQTLSLIYTPSSVPEPGTFALTALAALGWVIRRRCWKRTC